MGVVAGVARKLPKKRESTEVVGIYDAAAAAQSEAGDDSGPVSGSQTTGQCDLDHSDPLPEGDGMICRLVSKGTYFVADMDVTCMYTLILDV